MNTGQDITLQLFNNSTRHAFRFSGGPLSYSYQVHSIKLHFGTFDHLGSEHTVAGRQFPLEVWAMTRDFQQCGILISVDSGEAVQPPFKLKKTPNNVKPVAKHS